MFKKFIAELLEAETQDDIVRIFYRGENGIDAAYQKEKISFAEHEMLYKLAIKLKVKEE